MANWHAIKTEYLTTDTSYRKLAQKYGVNATTIAKKASKEGWPTQRQQQASKTLSKTLNAVSTSQATRATKLMDVSDLLLQKVRQRVEALDALETGSQEFRQISATLKDLKEIQMIRSDADLREQEARIKNLQRQAEQDDSGTEVVITFGSEDAGKWAR